MPTLGSKWGEKNVAVARAMTKAMFERLLNLDIDVDDGAGAGAGAAGGIDIGLTRFEDVHIASVGSAV